MPSRVSVEFSSVSPRAEPQAKGVTIDVPVSDSKVPAEQGRLVGMILGDWAAADASNQLSSQWPALPR
jgi:hypothetical protein